MKLKRISEQVVVVLGASSGIGRETALRLAERGAKVVVAARGERGLSTLVDEIVARGGDAVYAICDVADSTQVEAVAETAIRTFGRIDTWVNVAAVSVYATFEETTVEEFRRILEVNVMGQANGAKSALPRLREAGGGALIGISSVEALVSIPLHSAYAASKHAVDGFLDALRRELLAEGAPISITSIKPAAINTPFFNNARTKIGVKPQGPAPVYQPSVVADCVLFAAENPVRDLYAGGAAKLLATSQMLAPEAVDAALSRFGIQVQRTDEPKSADAPDNMYTSSNDYRVEGDFTARAVNSSPFTWLETNPLARTLATAAILGGATWLLSRGERRSPRMPHDTGGQRYQHEPMVPSRMRPTDEVRMWPALENRSAVPIWYASEAPSSPEFVVVEATEVVIAE